MAAQPTGCFIMKLIKPSVEILKIDDINLIELAGRTCYKSEDKITKDSAKTFVGNLIKNGHEAMIEHAAASAKVVCDRGIAHEIVRHRHFSFAQESTRYCNYSKDKFDKSVTFIIPLWIDIAEGIYTESPVVGKFPSPRGGGVADGVAVRLNGQSENPSLIWFDSMLSAEKNYFELLAQGWVAQQARSVLPNSLKTEIVITGNFREWRHFFKLRCAQDAHPQMREIAGMIISEFEKLQPEMIWK